MTIGHPNSSEMAALIRKLDAITSTSTRRIVDESKTNSSLAVALRTAKTEQGVRVSRYEIIAEKQNIGGMMKNRYTIKDLISKRIMYQDLSLFESAMSIVKRLLKNPYSIECDNIARLDTDYDNCVVEAYTYKKRLSQTSETVRRDVYEAKYSNAVAKLKEAKHRIVKTL